MGFSMNIKSSQFVDPLEGRNTKETKIADSVYLSLFMTSNEMCNNDYAALAIT